MQHRAAFARALASRPSLLLMDEPFGALDAITRERMHEFLLDIWEQHRITIIFVTHDIEEAILLGDRVAVMGGRPPGIGEIIDIPLRRPRHALDTDTEAFLTAKRRIRAALRSVISMSAVEHPAARRAGFSTSPRARPTSRSPRTRTSAPTWPPTGGPGAGPGPAGWPPARWAWSSSRCCGSWPPC